jgi:nucleotide-binding universal stress UspA family protein
MSERDAMSLGTPADRWPAHREERALAPDRRHPVIVVGLDGSATSWDAFAWAVGEATRSNGTLTAVYATPLVNRVAAFGMPFDYAAAEQAWQDAAAELRDEAEQRVRGLGLRLEFVREQGDPAQALTRVAGCAQADLIVVGTSAKMRHHVTRSLGRRLLSKRGAPVIAVVP